MKSRKTGWGDSVKLKATLSGLLLGCMMMATGCASNSTMQPSVPSQVVVDQSLMAKPSYTQELLNFLSDKPKEQTPK